MYLCMYICYYIISLRMYRLNLKDRKHFFNENSNNNNSNSLIFFLN